MSWFIRLRWIAKTIVWLREVVQRARAANIKSEHWQGGWVFDAPDPRDWLASSIPEPKRIELKDWIDLFEESKQESINQGLKPACTAFGTTMLKRHEDSWEHGKLIPHNPWEQWEYQGQPPNGDRLDRSLQVMVDNAPYTDGRYYPLLGYRRVITRGQYDDFAQHIMHTWLARKKMIKTGIYIREMTVDGETHSNMYWAARKGFVTLDYSAGRIVGGHDITIIGIDVLGKYCGVPGFLAWTSWGKWGLTGDGKFIIPFGQINHLMTSYIMHDAIDEA